MITIFWAEFGILFAAALGGGVAILPYSLRLMDPNKPLKMSLSKLLLLSFIQTAVLFAIITSAGLVIAHAVGLGAPYLESALAGTQPLFPFIGMIDVALPLGVAAGAFLLIADLFFLPYWPKPLVESAQKTTLWENFFASLYGGINEELLTRLFGLSLLAWLLSRVWHTPAGLPTSAVFWIANILMAILFGLGHLPALKGLLGTIPSLMLVRSLLLNAPIALICGWLFWRYGIEAAIVAHFSADIVYHVCGTVVLRSKLREIA